MFATCNCRMAALRKYRLDEHGNINDGRIPKLTQIKDLSEVEF